MFDPTLMATREEALTALLSLSPAPIFTDAYRQKRLPENLDIYFGPPEEFFLAYDSQSPYTDGGLIPILDDGNFGIVTFLEPSTRAIVQKDVESPFEEYARFQNWQQYLGSLVMSIIDSTDDNERVRVMSDLVGFKYIEELLAFLQSTRGLTHSEFNSAKASFLAALQA